MKEPYFSLILPIYNVAGYLPRCIDAILNNDFQDYEVILVDDGSLDESSAICDEYAKKYPFIHVIHKENGGLSSARNAGLMQAKGEYVFWIDSDDWIELGSLKELYVQTENRFVDILKFNYYKRPDNKEVKTIISSGYYQENEIKDRIIPVCLEKTGRVVFSAWSHIYRTDFLKEHSLRFISEREIGSEDYLFNFQAYMCAKSLLVLDECIYNYDFREGSLTNRYRNKMPQQYRILHSYMIDYAKKQGLYEKYKTNLAVSYISKSFGTCMRNECIVRGSHTLYEGWKRCRWIMKQREFREALKNYPFSEVPFKEKIKLIFMKFTLAIPLMYLLMRGIKRENI